MKIAFIFKTFLLALLFIACNPKDVNPFTTFEIYLDYWNTTGKNPEIRFSEMYTSKEVKIDFTQTFEGQTDGKQLTKVIIDNFKIVDDQSNNYNIESIKAFEFRSTSNEWKEDVEFTMDYSQTQNIGEIVLVLDRSESLGGDFEKIKQYAIEFVEQTFTKHPDVKMGIVDFSTEVLSYPITNNKAGLKEYISNMNTDRFTALYEAIDTGIEMLMKSKSQSRVLLTFTDGNDNMSDGNYYTLENILSKIQNDRNANKIRSFFIGLEGKGGIDNGVTKRLSTAGWIVRIPTSADEVKDVFSKFANLISNVYHLTYTRNQQVVPKTTPIKLKFEIKTSKTLK